MAKKKEKTKKKPHVMTAAITVEVYDDGQIIVDGGDELTPAESLVVLQEAVRRLQPTVLRSLARPEE